MGRGSGVLRDEVHADVGQQEAESWDSVGLTQNRQCVQRPWGGTVHRVCKKEGEGSRSEKCVGR